MGTSLNYKVGTMIEIPRAALVADEVCLLKQSPMPLLVILLTIVAKSHDLLY